MRAAIFSPKQALNKAYLKEKVIRNEFDLFKKNLNDLIEKTRVDESEEHSKTPLIAFLKDTFYKEKNEINTKDRIDLVIYNDKTSKSSAGVLMEVKKSANTAEMITKTDFNKKAFHELILYYLRERIDEKNIDIKYIIATNIYEWFIFDSSDFERLFYKNNKLVKDYNEWNTKQKVTQNTDLFYNDIAKPFIASLTDELKCTYFDLRDYKIDSDIKEDEKKLIPIYKIFSPAHLLKQPFANDSNRLDRAFYNELLHIIGLEETKEKNKKVITRKSETNRDKASLIENAISILKSRDKLAEVPNIQSYGKDKEERAYNVALELCITWINRILFLKLLESQLYKYHNNDADYKFLNEKTIIDYDELDKLFFEVLAINTGEREKVINLKYSRVPYLNSSLFEPNDLEKKTIFIANLDDNKKLTFYTSTVLKDEKGKRRKDENKHTLHYLFEFLEAYDFTSEGREEIQEENKTLINASVLGLIFEKINGYKDGSFFTPGFITMYMCRETIRRAVVQKFNDKYEWKCEEFDDLYNHLTGKIAKEIKEYNSVINSLTLCDPAVGSGHFLVSALNEIIAIKSELGILADERGRTLRDYDIRIENDELIVTSNQGTELFEYVIQNNKPHEESQRVQKTLFHEKQTIIENCLFGVDINPNSVKIARLRLWIELLKNAYYTEESGYKELETLPNIDINIKEGNSLISRFAIDTDLKKTLKTVKWKVEDYRTLVHEYKNTHDKETKRGIKKLIADIKDNFRSEISAGDPKRKRLSDLTYELHNKFKTEQLFDHELSEKEKVKRKKEEEKLVWKIEKLSAEIKEIEEGEIYRNAFEWRFEFPEVLADNGDYIGFDVVIGNPPYIRVQELGYAQIDYYKKYFSTAFKRIDISILFFERARDVIRKNGFITYISSNQFLSAEYGQNARSFLLNKLSLIRLINYEDLPVFEEALTYVSIFELTDKMHVEFRYKKINQNEFGKIPSFSNSTTVKTHNLSDSPWILTSDIESKLFRKISSDITLDRIGNTWAGLFTGLDSVLMFDMKNKISSGIEKDLFLPVIRAKDFNRYSLPTISKYVLYPYRTEGAKTILYEEGELKRNFPKAYDYLLRNKNILLKRKDSRRSFTEMEAWYKLTRFGQKRIFDCKKIISPGEVKRNKFTLDTTKSGFSCARVFAITIDNCSYPIEYILGLLNSKLIEYYIQQYAPVKAGGYYSYSSNVLNKIPIKITYEYKKAISNNVNKILKIKQAEPENDCFYLESQIDILVYKLYELTYDEVKIVDPAFALSEEEYKNYEVV